MPFFPFLISVYFLLASLAETQLGKNCDFPSPHHHIHRYWYFHVINDLVHISTPFMAKIDQMCLKSDFLVVYDLRYPQIVPIF